MDDKKTQRRNLRTWIIYDVGNSFWYAAISAMFLAQRLILDNHIPDIRYGASFSVATAVVLIISPLLGARSDKIGRRLPFLKWSTVGLIIMNGAMAFVALSPRPNKVRGVLALSVVVQIFYQTCLIFYNALLKNVSQEDTRGKIAGIGEGMSSIGRIIALLLFVPIADGAFAFIGEPGRNQVFLPAFVLSTLLMLPILIRFKEHKQPVIQATKNVYQKTWAGIKQLWTTQKNVGLYLLAFSLISDLVLTMTLYLAVVMDAVYKVGESMKSTFLIIFLVTGIISGYIFGKRADKYGYKKMLMVTCFLVILTALFFFSFSTPRMLYPIAAIGGISSGGYFVITRAFMAKLAPPGELGEYFGLYSTFQKAASITAPLVRGGITLRLIQYPVLKYQVAGRVMTTLLVVGTILMYKVKEPQPK